MSAIRAVLDTNIVVASQRSESPTSPNREVIKRWEAGEFVLLYSDDVLLEYIEKLIETGVGDAIVRQLISSVLGAGERVMIAFFHLRRYPSDADDIAFVLCALNGEATHRVTYDGGFSEVARDCAFTICAPLVFLTALRAHGRD
jgi:predicted nucleic acid-binding protein